MPDHLDSLRLMPLFSHCSNEDLEHIARATDSILVEPGRVLVNQGDLGREAFIVLDAEVEVAVDGKVVATLGPAEPFGEMALLENKPRNATVTVTKPGTVLVLGQREFAGLLEEPAFARALLIALADRVREKDQTYVG